MKITAIIENEKKDKKSKIKQKHGLSFYTEFHGKKIMVDLGSDSLFIKNSEKLGINVKEIDILIISHAHIDHGGGLKWFLKINKKARIYLHEKSKEKYYTKVFNFIPFYIGLDHKILRKNQNRIIYINKNEEILKDLFLEVQFKKTHELAKSNRSLFRRENKHFTNDDFKHEICILFKESDGLIIISPCSHSGINNILENISIRYNNRIKVVIGGFHLYNPISKKSETTEFINNFAKTLKPYQDTEFYTCHCTGRNNYLKLKENMKDKIKEINVGETITI